MRNWLQNHLCHIKHKMKNWLQNYLCHIKHKMKNWLQNYLCYTKHYVVYHFFKIADLSKPFP